MPPRPAIVGHALAEATVRPSHEPAGSVYGPSIADHEIASRRAFQYSRARRLYPAYNAATLACSRLGPLSAARRTGLVVATSAADRRAVGRIPEAFLTPCEAAPRRSRRLDVLVAVSRFISGGLAQDIATMLGTRGPELCLPGDCGVAPLAVASLFVETGRADTMVVVAVDPRPDDSACYGAVAVVIERPATAGRTVPAPHAAAMTTDRAACVPAIGEYLSHAPAPHAEAGASGTQCAVRWARQATLGSADPASWLDAGRQLLDECLQVAGTRELGVVAASFADLSPEHALHAIEHGASPAEVAHEAGRATFEDGLRRHASRRAVRGPYVAVTGIPGASLLALAIAEDLIGRAVAPAVAVLAGDWMGTGTIRALEALSCPERPHLRSSVTALVLERASDQPAARRMRSFVARRDACDKFGAELSAHAPSHTMASGCTGQDLTAARHFITAPSSPAEYRGRPHPIGRTGRFLGADAAACLADLLALPGSAALSIRNDLGGSGLVLLDAAVTPPTSIDIESPTARWSQTASAEPRNAGRDTGERPVHTARQTPAGNPHPSGVSTPTAQCGISRPYRAGIKQDPPDCPASQRPAEPTRSAWKER